MMTRLSLRGDWQAELRRMFPRVTPAQIEAFAALAVADKLLTDEGALSDAGHLWCRGVAR